MAESASAGHHTEKQHMAEFEKELKTMIDEQLKDYVVRRAVKLQSRIDASHKTQDRRLEQPD